MTEIVPNMDTGGVSRRPPYEPTSGYADPVATTYAYADRARDHGAELFLPRPRSPEWLRQEAEITGVETDRGLISTPAAVVATGPWCNRLATLLWESACR